MKIEEGKSYRTRSGLKAGPVYVGYNGDFYCKVIGDEKRDRAYHPNGSHWYGDKDLDLISEWTDEPTGPVRTRTVTEIVEGVYGIIEVSRVYPDGVNIIANPAKLGADALRAAAATLTEIAEALEASK